MPNYYEAFGVSGADVSNYGAFVTIEQAEQMAEHVGAPAILEVVEAEPEGGSLFWVIADESELEGHEHFDEGVEVVENPSGPKMLGAYKFFDLAQKYVAHYQAQGKDAYLEEKQGSARPYQVWINRPEKSARSANPLYQMDLNPFDFPACIRRVKRKGVTNANAYCAVVDRRMHQNPAMARAKNPSLRTRASEAFKDLKHAITKSSTSKKALKRLQEAETKYVTPEKWGLGKKRNPLFAPGDWITWTSPKNQAVTGVVVSFKEGATSLQDKVTFKSDGGQRGYRRGSKFTVDANNVRHSSSLFAPKRNPEGAAESLYEEFHGRGSQEVLEITEEEHEHSTLTALGALCQLRVKTPTGKHIINVAETKSPRDYPNPLELPIEQRVMLCSSEDGTSLYFVGGDQSVDTEALGFTKAEHDKDLMVLGVLEQVTYMTQKGFDGFEDVAYYHALGEESGEKPSLLYDTRSGLLKVAGGAYEVKPEGIVN